MKFPIMDYIPQSKDMITNFQGLDANLTGCTEGEFNDMKNITTQYYPVLSPRNRRSIAKRYPGDLLGIYWGEKLVEFVKEKPTPESPSYISFMYIDGERKYTYSTEQKTIVKMGAYIAIFPDKAYVNLESGMRGSMEASYTVTNSNVGFRPCKADGTDLGDKIHDEDYYKSHSPKSGDIMLTYNAEGKASYKIYSELTSMWSTITSTYFSIDISGNLLADIKEGDGVKISILKSSAWSGADKIFVNDEGTYLSNNFVIKKKNGGKIVVIGILDTPHNTTNIKVERKVPDISYVTECQNRLWGCSKDGHEIYCCKLGDLTNWNYFEGIASDSYAATVGSDGVFTGATTFNNNPIFFKENSYLKVTVSSTGAHSYREQMDRGVQKGSSRSICNVNGVLYYKGVTDVYAYDGSSPIAVGEQLGEHRYFDAVSGTINGRYYMSVRDDDKRIMFVYDSTKGIWAKEDDVSPSAFITHDDRLYFVESDNLVCIDGAEGDIESPIGWYAESGYIGFAMPGNKYVSKFNIRLSLEIGAYCDLWIQYDNETGWRHIFNMSGRGAKSFTIPVTIQRCDHFRYKISGKGGCKIYSISKTIEEGSDV